MKFFIIFKNILKLIHLYLFGKIPINVLAYFFSIKINKIVKKNITNISIVFDLQTVPPTFGEFIFYLVLSKYLKLKGKKIELILISDFNKKSQFNLLDKKKFIHLRRKSKN